jgi:hypothetical protein
MNEEIKLVLEAIQNKLSTKSFLLHRRLVLEAQTTCNLCGIRI